MTTSSDPRRDRSATSMRPLMPRLAASALSTRSSPSPSPRLAAGHGTGQYQGTARPTSSTTKPFHGSSRQNSTVIDQSPSADLMSYPDVHTALKPQSQSQSRSIAKSPPKSSSVNVLYMRPASPAASTKHVYLPQVFRQTPSREAVNPDQRIQESAETAVSEGAKSKSTTRTADALDIGINSMFFRSDDILTSKSTPPNLGRKKASSFMYADGKGEFATKGPDSMYPVIASPHESDTHHVYRPASTPMVTRYATANRDVNSSDVATTESRTDSPNVSPSRLNMHLSYRKGISQIMKPGNVSPFSGVTELSHFPFPNLPSPTQAHPSPKLDGTGNAATEALLREVTDPLLASPPDCATKLVEQKPDDKSHLPLLDSATPDLAGISPRIIARSAAASPEGFGAADTAARARRERKVLDLEISNSSLLAINKSLEREVRKQKTEIRRMRRMTRNLFFDEKTDLLRATDRDLDRLTEDASEIFHGDTAVALQKGMSPDSVPHSRASEVEMEDDDAIDESSSGYEEGFQESPERLRLDLVKHRELLMNSQKLNQSIKRCLGMTDLLISDATKALAYRVPVDEIRLGGRVLIPDDDDDDDDDGGRDNADDPNTKLHESTPCGGFAASESPHFTQ